MNRTTWALLGVLLTGGAAARTVKAWAATANVEGGDVRSCQYDKQPDPVCGDAVRLADGVPVRR